MMNGVGSEFGYCGIHGREKINLYGCASCKGGATTSAVNGVGGGSYTPYLYCEKHNTRYALDAPGCPLCPSEKGAALGAGLKGSDTSGTDPMQIQVGGDHYKKMKIQPMEFSMANGLDACQHTIIKYVTRFRDKGGIADLEKARHVIDMLIQFEKDK